MRSRLTCTMLYEWSMYMMSNSMPPTFVNRWMESIFWRHWACIHNTNWWAVYYLSDFIKNGLGPYEAPVSSNWNIWRETEMRLPHASQQCSLSFYCFVKKSSKGKASTKLLYIDNCFLQTQYCQWIRTTKLYKQMVVNRTKKSQVKTEPLLFIVLKLNIGIWKLPSL